jgi:hypothetical protein
MADAAALVAVSSIFYVKGYESNLSYMADGAEYPYLAVWQF